MNRADDLADDLAATALNNLRQAKRKLNGQPMTDARRSIFVISGNTK